MKNHARFPRSCVRALPLGDCLPINFLPLEKLPYLKDADSTPRLPHLIIVPGTLRAQWLHELETLLIPKSVDILLYESKQAGNSSFWEPSGPFHSSRQSPENKIIVTTHSVRQLSSQNVLPSHST